MELIKGQYRDQIAMQLIQEEEEEKRHAQSKIVKKGKKKEREENLKVEIEVYDEKYWLPYPFYKYFFDDESIVECLVLLSKENFEKTPQKKKKPKKPASTPNKDIKQSISKECNNIKEPVKELIQTEVKVMKKEIPVVKKEVPVVQVNKTVKSKKKKRKNKATRLEDKKTIKEYEELKQRTFKLFAKLTNTSIPPKKNNKSKRSSKHNIKAKKPEEEVEENNDCLSCQGGTTASHISEFISSDNNEEDYEEKLLAPYVGTYFEVEFFNSLNIEIETFTNVIMERNKRLKKFAECMKQSIVRLVQELFTGIGFIKIRCEGDGRSIWFGSCWVSIRYK